MDSAERPVHARTASGAATQRLGRTWESAVIGMGCFNVHRKGKDGPATGSDHDRHSRLSASDQLPFTTPHAIRSPEFPDGSVL